MASFDRAAGAVNEIVKNPMDCKATKQFYDVNTRKCEDCPALQNTVPASDCKSIERNIKYIKQ